MGGLNDEAPLNLSEKPLAFWERQVRLLVVRPDCIPPRLLQNLYLQTCSQNNAAMKPCTLHTIS